MDLNDEMLQEWVQQTVKSRVAAAALAKMVNESASTSNASGRYVGLKMENTVYPQQSH